ncbi:MAG TPA: GAF domain-containing protein [Anaeromyxobacteraceae bacterium]|nr:GAF domain-containing protein [Anaeromyxobacteraceae bacterium]
MEPMFERALAAVRAGVRGRERGAALAAACAALRELPGYTGVYLYVLEGEALALHAHAGRDTEHVRIPIGQGICGLSARTKQAVIVDDVAADPRYLACNLETRSEIVAPILRGDRYLAQIDVDSDAPAAFGPRDRAFLAEVAGVLEPLFP